MNKVLHNIGCYFILIKKVFVKPERHNIFFRQLIIEVDKLVIGSLGIVAIISFFMGMVVTIQMALNFENPIIPRMYIGLTTRDSLILEFSSTVLSLILAGKVGSNIASEIGTMRVTEQIEALDVMGVNSANYLILPKILACVFFNPILVVLSIFIGIIGGFLVGTLGGLVTTTDFLYGLHYAFIPYYFVYTIVKTVIFAFILTSVPAFYGYHVKGGALEVGRASTKSVVYSMILILVFNYIITQLMLA